VTGCGSTVEPRCRIADRRSSITMQLWLAPCVSTTDLWQGS